jgi:ribosomal protein L37AE/L43A
LENKSQIQLLLVAVMTDFPRSLLEFQQALAMKRPVLNTYAAARWPDGFVCPGCGGSKARRLETKAWTYECTACGRQTSVTAGTIMHHSKLPLTAWFWASHLMTTHSNGISALQVQRQPAFGSYKTAWLLCAKLRRSMLAPGRSPPDLLQPQGLGPWASIMGCAASTSNPSSMNSSSASIAGAPGTPRSDPCWASPQRASPCLTTRY